MSATSRIWGTQENAIASLKRHGLTTVYRHRSLPIVGLLRAEGRPAYALFVGASAKPRFYYAAKTLAAAVDALQGHWKAAEASFARKAAAKAERAEKRAGLRASDHFMVGDVLVNTWGYDQTNVDYYQVTEVGARSVMVRAIEAKTADDGNQTMTGRSQPDRYKFTGPAMRKQLSEDGSIRFEFGGCRKWDGKASRYSYYA